LGLFLVIGLGETLGQVGHGGCRDALRGHFLLFNFRFEADKMFYQPGNKTFAAAATNAIPLNKLVTGVVVNGEAKAYPIQLIGYHHQVRDTIGTVPVMITYCIVCRTGRVLRDTNTGSSWNMEGLCVEGKLKEQRLTALPAYQEFWHSWSHFHPATTRYQ
jgi:hypothetical protein